MKRTHSFEPLLMEFRKKQRRCREEHGASWQDVGREQLEGDALHSLFLYFKDSLCSKILHLLSVFQGTFLEISLCCFFKVSKRKMCVISKYFAQNDTNFHENNKWQKFNYSIRFICKTIKLHYRSNLLTLHNSSFSYHPLFLWVPPFWLPPF